MKISKNLKKDVDTIEDSSWRNSISLLECNSKIYDLRTDKFKSALNNVIEETQKDSIKLGKKKDNQIDRQMEEFDRVFYDGKDTVAQEGDIAMNQIEMGFEKDPLISHISSKFSGSGIRASFFHNLEVRATQPNPSRPRITSLTSWTTQHPRRITL